MDFQLLFDILPYQQVKFPNAKALVSKHNGQWKSYATATCIEEINQVSAGLLQLGLKSRR